MKLNQIFSLLNRLHQCLTHNKKLLFAWLLAANLLLPQLLLTRGFAGVRPTSSASRIGQADDYAFSPHTLPYIQIERKGYYLPEAPLSYSTRSYLGANMSSVEKEAVRQALQSAFLTFVLRQIKSIPSQAAIIMTFNEIEKAARLAASSGVKIALDPFRTGIAYKLAMGNAIAMKDKPIGEQVRYMISLSAEVIALVAPDPASKIALFYWITKVNSGLTLFETITNGIKGWKLYEQQTAYENTANPLGSANIEFNISNLLEQQVAKLVGLAATNPQYSKFVDDNIAIPNVGVSVNADAYSLARDSKLSLMGDYLKQYVQVQPDGSVSIGLNDVNALYRDLSNKLGTVTSGGIKLAKEADQMQGGLNRGQKLPLSEEEKIQKAYVENQQVIDFADSGIRLVSTLASFFNPKLGQQIGMVGGAAVKIATGVNKILKSTSSLLKATSTITKIAGVIGPIGQIAGGLLDVFSAFGGGPSADEVILEQISALRQQVEELRVEMHARFDRIEENLGIIFDTIIQGFERIGKDITQVRTDIIKLYSNLDRMESNIYDWLKVGFRRDLIEATNFYIGYQNTYNKKMPYDTFIVGENKFFTHAKDFSRDALQQDYLNRGYQDADLYYELNKGTVDSLPSNGVATPARNTTYLFQVARRNLGLQLISEKDPLPNLYDWQRATEFYLQLGRENTDHREQINPDRLKALYDEGKRLSLALEAVTTVQTSNGPRANRVLFDRLIDKYRLKVFGLEKALNDAITNFNNGNSKYAIIKGLDPWAGASQIPQGNWPLTKFNKCDGGSLSLSIPTSILNSVQSPYILADYLGLGKLEICADLSWFDEKVISKEPVFCQFPSDATIDSYAAKLKISISAKYKGQTLLTKYVISDKEVLSKKVSQCLSDPYQYNTDIDNEARQNWEQGMNLKSKFETASLEDTVSLQQIQAREQILQQAISDDESYLRGYQKDLYIYLLQQFQGSSNVFTTARELSGAKSLLNAFITLGMPQSVESNDVLHALMHGTERLPDEEGISANIDLSNDHYQKDDIRQLYENALASLADNKLPPKVSVLAIALPRIEALSKELVSILSEINQYHQYKQADSIINNYPQPQKTILETLSHIENVNRSTFIDDVLVAHPQVVTTAMNQPQIIHLIANNIDDRQLSFNILAPPTHGSLSGNSPDLVYTPVRGFIGKDSFTFKVSNGTAESNVANVVITVSSEGCSGGSFKLPYFFTLSKAKTYPTIATPNTSSGPYASAKGDFNKDGKPDLAVANWGSDDVAIMLGDGAGGFGTATNYGTVRRPYWVAVGDFNSDGNADLAVTQALGSSNQISVLFGDGTGKFSAPSNFTVGLQPYAVATGDFNKDGKTDLVVTNHLTNNLSLLLGDGRGGFAAAKNYTAGVEPAGLVVTDLNKDGNSDVVVIGDTTAISVLLGDGKGSFGATTSFPSGRAAFGIVAGDFNNDGNPDIAVGEAVTNNVSIFLGNGKGQLGTAISYSVGFRVWALTSFDYNRDGKLDLVAIDDTTKSFAILQGGARGDFTLLGVYSAGTGQTSVIAHDLNNDNVPDLVFTTKTDNVAVWLSNGASDFNTPPDVIVGANPYSVNVGDFNSDGKADLVTANHYSNSLSVALGKGDGTFTAAVNYTVGTKPVFTAIGDFNKDNKLDLAVTNLGTGAANGGSLSILLGDGTGKFTKQPDIRVGSEPFSITTGDYNRDGKLDLAVTDVHTSAIEPNIYLLIGNGTGGFTLSGTVTAKKTPRFITTSDVNKDGLLDLIVSNANSNDVLVLQGNGLGGFREAATFGVGDGPIYHVMDDFDKDGVSDLAAVNIRTTQNLSLMLGAEGSLFEGFTNYTMGTGPSAAVSGDFDLDGNLDLAVVHEVANGVKVLSGNGYGTFSEKGTFGTGFESYSIAKGDFNMDGKLDLVIANYNTNSVSILLNTCPSWLDARRPATTRQTTTRTVGR